MRKKYQLSPLTSMLATRTIVRVKNEKIGKFQRGNRPVSEAVYRDRPVGLGTRSYTCPQRTDGRPSSSSANGTPPKVCAHGDCQSPQAGGRVWAWMPHLPVCAIDGPIFGLRRPFHGHRRPLGRRGGSLTSPTCPPVRDRDIFCP